MNYRNLQFNVITFWNNRLKRRDFIALSSSILAMASAKGFAMPLDSLKADQDTIKINESIIVNTETIVPITKLYNFPPLLAPGSKVAFASPSSTTNQWEVSKAIKMLNSLGLEVELGKIIKNQQNKARYLADEDQVRAEEFMELVARPDIDAIIAGRGGYGSMRMVEKLDFDVIAKNPKIYMGFSDFTFLLNAITEKAKIVTFHGPVGVSSFSQFTTNNFKLTTFANHPEILEIPLPQSEILTEGTTKAPIVGGNLTMLVAALGTPYEVQTDGKILFFEDINEQSYKIDRMLTQLKLSRKFSNLKGIIIGQFTGLTKRKAFYPNYGYSLLEVFEQILKPLNIPIMMNIPIGHISEQITIPINSIVEMDTKTKKIIYHYTTI